VNRNVHSRSLLALFVAALAALSCRSGESTGPTKLAALPSDSLPTLKISLPSGQAMTAGTTDRIVVAAVNMKPYSCAIAAPDWLGLTIDAASGTIWTAAPASGGAAVLVTSCLDFRSGVVSVTDTLQVYNKPTVSPNISGTVPMNVGDSINVSYDSTDTQKIDVVCSHCEAFASMTRVGANTVGLTAKAVPGDTTRRGLCFTVHGLDGRYTQQQCVTVLIVGPAASLYSVPTAIRAAEVVPLHTMPVATYDKTGESNHPDFMRVGAAWSNGACWMVFTPYAASNGMVENPSLATSPDCEHWSPAAGVKAPLIAKPDNGYNSDPELMYDAQSGCIGVVYREVNSTNNIKLTSSCDGKTFTAPRQLFAAPNHRAVSPTVAQGPDGFHRIFYVDAGTNGCTSQVNVVKMRTAISSTAGLDSIQFGPEAPVDLAQPGWVIWHIKVRYVAALKQYIAMYAAFPLTTGIGNCTNDDLFLATSADGVHWQSFQAPVINHLDRRFNFVSMYRASFQYEAKTDRLRTIVSGLEGLRWGQYGVVHNYTSLLGALSASSTVAAAQLVPSPKLVRSADSRVKAVIMEDRP
jgi:hypothetical protein